MIEDVLL